MNPNYTFSVLIISTLILSILTTLTFIIFRLHKKNYKWTGQVRQNCLITKTPLLILSAPQSLFSIHNSYGLFYSLFTIHGYTAEWEQFKHSRQLLLKKLDFWESKGLKFHFFTDPQFSELLWKIRKNRDYSCIRSVQLLDPKKPEAAIESAIEIAEQDFV